MKSMSFIKSAFAQSMKKHCKVKKHRNRDYDMCSFQTSEVKFPESNY